MKKSGCILFNNKKEIALVYREYANDYTFPKGHVENNESLIDCAVRETEEETKRKPLILSDKEVLIERYNANNEEIEVYYYLAKDIEKSDNQSLDTHPVFWIPFNQVYDKLSYNDSKETWKNNMNNINELIEEII